MNEYICEKCGLSFDNVKVKANHIRWKHGDLEKYKLSNKTSTLRFLENKLGKLKYFDVKCELCKNNFQVKEREKQFPKKEKYFCSRKCSNSHIVSISQKNKISKSIKKLWDIGKYGERYYPKLYDFKCVICEKIFQKISNNWESVNQPFKTCSDFCFRDRMSQSSRENPNCGGETNYKKYRYKEIWMDSTWEKELAEWMDLNNIVWERSKKLHQLLWIDIDGNKRRYYPDFYLPKYKIYIDTKNPYLMKCDEYKMLSAIRENKITLIYGNINDVKKELTKLGLMI